MISARLLQSLFLLVCVLIFLKTESLGVPVTILDQAQAKGGVCLDGSPPGYAIDKGVGEGVDNWLIFLQGGGWCNTTNDCYVRSAMNLGSSSKWAYANITFSGILSNEVKDNPYFYNWNRVYVLYCDGSSYLGDVEEPFQGIDRQIYFRGARVFDVIIVDLLVKGLKTAKNALLMGCSAGGLGAMLHCDGFRALLPATAKVKCASDGGYFINGTDIYGGSHIQRVLSNVIQTHAAQTKLNSKIQGIAKHLPESCTSKRNASLCMFPQNFAPFIQTPLFLIQSAFDYWQILNVMAPKLNDGNPEHDGIFRKYYQCRYDIENCTCDQVKAWRTYGEQFRQALSEMNANPTHGMFVTKCGAHCTTQELDLWLGELPKIDNVKIGEALVQWFRDDVPFRKVEDKHKKAVVCGFDPQQPNWNNNFTWGAKPMIANYTLQDEINRKARLVPLCPAEVPSEIASKAGEL